MHREPIHQNLSTSFINLGAMVKFLYRLQFVGRIHLELSSYEADIVFRTSNRVHAREYDYISGRLCDGERALRNILMRAKDPNGRIHVYPEPDQAVKRRGPARVFVDEAIVSGARKMAYGFCDTRASSVFEERSKADEASLHRDREELKELVLEILKNASVAFSKQRLDFEVLFRNACQIVSDRYPFVDPEAGKLEFFQGRLYAADSISCDELANAVSAVLAHILLRLKQSSEHHRLFDFTTHRMRLVLSRRAALLDRMLLRRQFERLVDY